MKSIIVLGNEALLQVNGDAIGAADNGNVDVLAGLRIATGIFNDLSLFALLVAKGEVFDCHLANLERTRMANVKVRT